MRDYATNDMEKNENDDQGSRYYNKSPSIRLNSQK